MILWMTAALAGPWEQTKAHRVRELEQARPPSVEERVALGDLVRDLVQAAPRAVLPPSLADRAAALGLELVVDADRATLVGTRGWGLVVVRLGAAVPVVLQAPHPWYDLGTGELTGQLFAESHARAAVFATTHRRLGPRTDVAHEAEGGFQILTLALAEAIQDPVVVQIHGFGEGHTGADVVVGGWGARSLTGPLAATGWVVADGVAVPTLAGRTNLQVRALTGRVPVVHLELSRELRGRLREDAGARAHLWTVLEHAAR